MSPNGAVKQPAVSSSGVKEEYSHPTCLYPLLFMILAEMPPLSCSRQAFMFWASLVDGNVKYQQKLLLEIRRSQRVLRKTNALLKKPL